MQILMGELNERVKERMLECEKRDRTTIDFEETAPYKGICIYIYIYTHSAI